MSNDPLARPASGNGPEPPKKQRPLKRGTSVADHYQIVVHVDERALRNCGRHGSLPGLAVPHDGAITPPRSDLPLETIRRLACDCSLIALVEDENGMPVGISRKTRLVPPHMRRALLARDRGCRFPGCHRHGYLDAHHLVHWINGGRTVLRNVILLCTYHHRLLHEGGFSIRQLDDGTLMFLRPDGRVIPPSGYRHADMLDDEIGDRVGDENRDEIRETRPRYGPALLAVT